MNRRLRLLILSAITAVVTIGLVWIGSETIYKGTVTIETDQNITVTIRDTSGATVASGSNKSYQLSPGSYTVVATAGQTGLDKQVTVTSLSTTKITMPATAPLHVSLVAPVAIYGAFPVGDSFIGFNPSDSKVKRIDRLGNFTNTLTTNDLASQVGEGFEPELPNVVLDYQPYQHDSAIAASNGLLYVVSKGSVKELSVDGIPIDHNSTDTPEFIIATNPSIASFAVSYKQNVFWYENADSKPKKIYTAKKEFNRLVYGTNKIGLYDTRIPPSKEDLRSLYDNHQVDLLTVDLGSGNKEQTMPGPISQATLSPDGTFATIHPRQQQPYLYNLQSQKRVADIDAPLATAPYWISNTNYLYAKNRVVWKYDTGQQQSTLLGELPGSATSFYQADSGDTIVTTYNDKDNAGIYRLSASSPATTLTDKLKAALPYTEDAFSITYTTVDTPTIVIQTRAPLNSANQLDRYKQETIQLRQTALTYLTNHHIDPATVTITYDPADPL